MQILDVALDELVEFALAEDVIVAMEGHRSAGVRRQRILRRGNAQRVLAALVDQFAQRQFGAAAVGHGSTGARFPRLGGGPSGQEGRMVVEVARRDQRQRGHGPRIVGVFAHFAQGRSAGALSGAGEGRSAEGRIQTGRADREGALDALLPLTEAGSRVAGSRKLLVAEPVAGLVAVFLALVTLVQRTQRALPARVPDVFIPAHVLRFRF